MPKGEAPEQSIVQRIGTVRGPDKDDVVAESVKLLHQGNRHTVHNYGAGHPIYSRKA